jgi:hypothetical protein
MPKVTLNKQILERLERSPLIQKALKESVEQCHDHSMKAAQSGIHTLLVQCLVLLVVIDILTDQWCLRGEATPDFIESLDIELLETTRQLMATMLHMEAESAQKVN